MFDLIAFDADDTLWHNERLYLEARLKFRQILQAHLVGTHHVPDTVDDIIQETEMRNLPYFGFGVMSFILSLIETAIQLTNGRVTGNEIKGLLDIAKEMLSAEVELFDQAEETLAALSSSHRLILITKGDLLHQQAKVNQSGLSPYFDHVEVVSNKSAETYEAILKRLGIPPERFLMVGNSMRSDILPVIAIGGSAVHIPNDLTWSYEMIEPPEELQDHYYEVNSLSELPALMHRLEETV
jgi:putative hydrolase of the HAD superfamily